MKIRAPQSIGGTPSGGTAVPYRTGDVVVVEVVRAGGVQSVTNEVLLKFPNGELLRTIFKEKFTGEEGEIFPVKIISKTKTEIYAEIVRRREGSPRARSMTPAQTLSEMGFEASEENIDALREMQRFGLPVRWDLLKALIESRDRFGALSPEQIAFALRYNIPINDETAALLAAFDSQSALLGEHLLALIKEAMDDGERRDALLSILGPFFGAFKNGAEGVKMPETVSNLLKILGHIIRKNLLGEKTKEKVEAFLSKADVNFKVMQLMSGAVSYIQIPVEIGGRRGTAELYAKTPDAKEEGERAVFFLRVPTNNLGVVEVFMALRGEEIELHFGAEKAAAAKIKRHILRLSDSIADIGLRLKTVTYNKISRNTIDLKNFEQYAALILGEKSLDKRG